MKKRKTGLMTFLVLVGCPLLCADVGPAIRLKLPDLMRPRYFDVDETRVYIVTDQVKLETYLFAGGEDHFQLSIRKGQGPQEYHCSPGIRIMRDRIVLNTTQKTGFYGRDGKYLGESRKKEFASTEYYLGEKTVRWVIMKKKGAASEMIALDLYSTSQERLKRICTFPYPDLSPYYGVHNEKLIRYLVIPLERPWVDVSGDLLYLVSPEEDIRIHVFDGDGRRVDGGTIVDLKRTKITEEDRGKILKRYEKSIDYSDGQGYFRNHIPQTEDLRFPEVFPRFSRVYIDGGRIYFSTYVVKDGLRSYLVYDIRGRRLGELDLPEYEIGTMPLFRNGRFYVLNLDEEEDEWYLTAVQL